MPHELSSSVAEFHAGNITVRVVRGFFGVLPFVATWVPTVDLDAAARATALSVGAPELADRIRQRAEQLARAEGPQAALAAFDFLDKGDKGIAIFSGLRSVYKAARKQEGALEMDPQQAADAGLKAMGISWATWKLFPGSAAEKARALTATEAGRALLAWYVAADLVLPFADNIAAGGTAAITGMIRGRAAENAKRLAAVAGGEAEEATGMLTTLMSSLESVLGEAAAYADPLASYVQAQVPSILGTADKVTGVVATGVDALASYRLIGASLVAEVCLAQAAAAVVIEANAERVLAEKAAADEATAERLAAARADREREAAAQEAERLAAARADREQEAAARRADAELRFGDSRRQDPTMNPPVSADAGRQEPAAASSVPGGCFGCGAGVVLLGVVGAGIAIALWWASGSGSMSGDPSGDPAPASAPAEPRGGPGQGRKAPGQRRP